MLAVSLCTVFLEPGRIHRVRLECFDKILSVKVCYYEATSRTLAFVKSYLRNRDQRVDVDGMRSSCSMVRMEQQGRRLIFSSFVSIDINYNPNFVFGSDSVRTLVFDPCPVLEFGSGLAFDSDPGSVLDSALRPAFISDSATNHSSDFNESRASGLEGGKSNVLGQIVQTGRKYCITYNFQDRNPPSPATHPLGTPMLSLLRTRKYHGRCP
ncbi:hypothetical protein EVAR_42618_1 [Eumeta japonica]|uniref:Uncharacterized protein n=1 Tax=Eumeta variegata TaxID=151549 RepID=A0A4C1WXP5_EUMVA|nr:hypothetical protein EVAR_42618_1 [Eumeta japonica]